MPKFGHMEGAKRIYYAHPISDYDTHYERAMISFLEINGMVVENPNQPLHQEGYEKDGMKYFMQVLEGCDGCVFSSFPGGIVGAGVAMEVQNFLDRNLPVAQLVDYYHTSLIACLPSRFLLLPIADRHTTRAMARLYKMMVNGGHDEIR
jgi:hypothetical protein